MMRAESRLRKRYRYVAIQVVLSPFEEFVVLNDQHDIQISGRTAFCAGIAFSGDAQFGPTVDTCGNSQLETFLTNHASIAPAHRASVLDHLPGSVTLVACPRDAEEPLL